MLIGYVPGVWDLFHVGHLAIITKARGLCDRLVVGVPSDQVVVADKGRRPVIGLEARMAILGSMRQVDVVVPYYRLSFMEHLAMFNPDVFVVGEDWGRETRHRNAEEWLRQNDRRFVIVPRYVGESTTAIRERIRAEGRHDAGTD